MLRRCHHVRLAGGTFFQPCKGRFFLAVERPSCLCFFHSLTIPPPRSHVTGRTDRSVQFFPAQPLLPTPPAAASETLFAHTPLSRTQGRQDTAGVGAGNSGRVFRNSRSGQKTATRCNAIDMAATWLPLRQLNATPDRLVDPSQAPQETSGSSRGALCVAIS